MNRLVQGESGVLPFWGMRLVSLYCLSLLAVLSPILAFEGGYGAVVPWSIILAGALLLGLAIGPRIEEFRDRFTNWQGGLTGWILYLLAVSWIMAMMLDPSAEGGASSDWRTLLYFQPVMLFVGGLGPGYRGALMNAFVLTVISTYAGGNAASQAVISYIGPLGFFLVFDHWTRKLVAYPRGEVPELWVPFRHALALVLPVVGVLALGFHFFPPSRIESIERIATTTVNSSGDSKLGGAILELLVGVVVGAMLVYLLGRFLGRKDDDRERKIVEEEVMMLASRREESFDRRRPVLHVEYSGLRGRIVNAYLRFINQAWALGLKRKPYQTPREFAQNVPGQQKHIRVLTLMFEKARYGDEEPTEGEVKLVEQIAGTVQSRWGRVSAVLGKITRRIATATLRRD